MLTTGTPLLRLWSIRGWLAVEQVYDLDQDGNECFGSTVIYSPFGHDDTSVLAVQLDCSPCRK